MTSPVRKFALATHVACSVGLLGAVGTFLALAVVGIVAVDLLRIRAAYLAMDWIARFIVVPLAFSALLGGIVQSLGTPWGLFRHYWVLVKFVLLLFATAVLLMQVDSIAHLARVAGDAEWSGADLQDMRISLIVHAGAGLLVLFVPLALSVYKPRGRTRCDF